MFGWGGDVDPETGEFVLYGLPAAPTAVCFGYCWADPTGFWFDGGPDFDDATLVALRPGSTTRITTHVPPND